MDLKTRAERVEKALSTKKPQKMSERQTINRLHEILLRKLELQSELGTLSLETEQLWEEWAEKATANGRDNNLYFAFFETREPLLPAEYIIAKKN